MPFDAVSDKGMIDFFKKYDIIVTDQDLPSRYTISRTALDDVYEMMLKNVKEQIKESSPKHVSVTFDLWTDRYRRLNYITFTLHYLTADFELKSFTLNTKLAQGKKTGEMILEMLNKTVAEFGLCDKTLHVVTDAGSNVKRAIALGNLDGHLCLGHGLHNLVIVDGIKRVPEVDVVVTKCKKIVKSIRYRLPDLEIEVETEQRKFLQEIDSVGEDIEFDENEPMVDEDLSSPTREDCSAETTVSFNNEFGEVNHVPTVKTSTPTRWHSVLAMLESLAHFCNRGPINEMLTKIGQGELKLIQAEWNIIEDMIRFLKKFREAVEVLSAQKTASINLALVFRTELKHVLDDVSAEDETLIIVSLKNNMLSNIDKSFPLTENIVCAALLDSRFSGLKEIDAFLEKEHTTRAVFLSEMIKRFVDPTDIATPDPVTMPSTSKTDTTSSLLNKLSLKHSSFSYDESTDPAFQECWKYLATAVPKELVEQLNGDLTSEQHPTTLTPAWSSHAAKNLRRAAAANFYGGAHVYTD
ncbi:uncharacterized protein LOC134754754 [Cydia strobilella]|uniref:uncharacterized protein LOC134754754 n=1 Tax=Cydia strobilella TaxID=1100964 RepID=UPI003007EECA